MMINSGSDQFWLGLIRIRINSELNKLVFWSIGFELLAFFSQAG